MEDQGIMALPQGGMQAPTAQPVAPQPGPAELAAFEQARMQADPKEVGDTLLEEARKADPAAVDQFMQMLQQIDLPPEVIDALGQMVDSVLADPQNYQEIRAEFIKEGVPEELLPPEFDAAYFGALNMALDQLSAKIAAPTPQAFAQGGMVANPIAAGIASMGRNGDTMLAHITPYEARMLRRRGGSGTINPATGLPEYGWNPVKSIAKGIGKVVKGIGSAIKGVVNGVKKFAQSSIGRVVTAVALGFFLGPAAAAALNITSAAGIAAMSGFVGGFGSSMLAGQSLKDSLKTGAIGAVTAGAVSGISGGMEAFQANAAAPTSASQALSQQVDKFTGGIESLTKLPEVGKAATENLATPSAPLAQADQAIQYPGSQIGPGVDTAAIRPTTVTDVTAPTIGPSVPSDVMPADVASGQFADRAIMQAGYEYGPNGLQRYMPADVASGQFADRALAAAQQPPAAPYNYIDSSTVVPEAPLTDRVISGAQDVGRGIMDFYKAAPNPADVQSAYLEELSKRQALGMNVNLPSVQEAAMKAAEKSAAPLFGTTSRVVGTGLAGLALTGGFKQQPAEPLNIAPTETGYDLLRRNPEIYAVNVGGGRTVYPSQGIAYFAKGGLAGKATKLETKATKLEGKGKTEKAGVLRAKSQAFSAKAEAQPGISTLQNPANLRGTAPVGQIVNPAYEEYYKRVTAPNALQFSEEGIGQFIEDRRAGESGRAYKTRFFTEAANLLRQPKDLFITDPNYVVEEDKTTTTTTQTPITVGSSIVSSPAIVSVGGTTVPTIAVGGGTTSAPLYTPSAVTPGPLPNPLITTPDFTQVTQPNVNVVAPAAPTMTNPMPSVPYTPATFTSPEMYQWHSPAYATSYGLAAQNNPYFPQQEQPRMFAQGGIAAVAPRRYAMGGYAGGGNAQHFPRRTGAISGPGTGTSDDIPAMLSDGEFVMTAKAVRGAGGGSRREGAKRMYQMMRALERKA
jgi:hypothetical protein